MSSVGTSTQRHCPSCGSTYPGDYAICPRDATPLQGEAGAEDPLCGTLLGDTYEVLQRLGEGGMGRVYEARHVRLGRRFAAKVLHHAFASDREAVARFRREATAAAAIPSPHVAQVFDVNVTRDGQPFLIYELLEGADFGSLLQREGALAVGRATRIARQVAAGLRAAHDAGVVHRDLKPENVMLVRGSDGGEFAKVLDFGIAKMNQEDKLTRTGAVLGTPAYMAPEQARGGSTVDHRVDVYALGAILYRALTGQPAFAGEDAGRTLTSVIWDEPPRPKTLRRDLPEALELVIQRAMAKDPDARFASMAELDAALAPFDQPDAAAPSTVPAAVPPAGSVADESRAATVFVSSGTSGSTASIANARARTTSLARWARPRAVAFGLLALAWCGVLAGSLLGWALLLFTHHTLGPVEQILVVALALALTAPLAVLEGRRLAHGAWRNTATMLGRADVLARATGVSLAAYAAVSGPGLFWALLHHEHVPVATELPALLLAAVTGGVLYARPRR
jgi:serine/threonine-protein kinase